MAREPKTGDRPDYCAGIVPLQALKANSLRCSKSQAHNFNGAHRRVPCILPRGR